VRARDRQLHRRGFDNLPVDAVPEQLRQQSGHAIVHDRGRALDSRVQELNYFPRFDRACIAVRLVGELLLQDSFRVLRVFAALAQVPLGEIFDQCRHVVGIARDWHLDASPRGWPVHGAPRADPLLQQIVKPL
jgi:hypothetical protein